MKPLSENVYAYSPEAKEFTAYPISILFVTEPWFGLGEGGTVFSTSLTAEDGHVTEPWLMKCTGSHLGFWENSLAASLLLLLSGLPPLPSRKVVWPWGWPIPLTTARQFQPKLKGRRAAISVLDFYVKKYISDLLKSLFIQVFSLCAAEQNLSW